MGSYPKIDYRSQQPYEMGLTRRDDGLYADADPQYSYLGGESIEPAGASAEATLPAGTDTVEIQAEGGAIYYLSLIHI